MADVPEPVPNAPVLLTGASGNLGRVLARELAAQGWALRLTDIAPFPDPLPPRATFVRADLADGVALLRQAEGCGTILHFGGISVEQPFETVLDPNIRGLHHVYEAARREHARVVFASSNHSIGFHERPGMSGGATHGSTPAGAPPIGMSGGPIHGSASADAPPIGPRGNEALIGVDCAFRPDGYYGLSKAYGELMGRLYWDKHGVENVNLRIGSCIPEPTEARMLATWLSYADLVRLAAAAVTAPRTGHCVIWACSANPATFWGHDHRERIGWQPRDSAESWRAQIGDKRSGNPVIERYQGGSYTAIDYSRAAPSPRDPFALS